MRSGGGWRRCWLPRSGGGNQWGFPCGGQSLICSAGPALPLTRRRRTTLLPTGGAARVLLFAPDLTLHRLQPQVAVRCCARSWKRRLQQRSLTAQRGWRPLATSRGRGRDPARTAQLSSADGCWLLRLPPSAIWHLVRHAVYTPSYCSRRSARYSVHSVAPSWWIVGRVVLQGRLDQAWLLAWALPAHFGSLPPVRDLVVVYLLSTEGPQAAAPYGALRLNRKRSPPPGAGQPRAGDRVRGCGIPCPEWWTLGLVAGIELP